MQVLINESSIANEEIPSASVTSSMRTLKSRDPQSGYDNYFAVWLMNVTSGYR
ncbi:hypothetical protein KIN20_006407 [Parelaphostrongylus tenuis]|uniref:Uncharacterized protein n=1 Tax=Parelaphostrongylus tenuis TaxID=148309 RepID=A0AAD5M607_PARTN|nr:hypothetical protein KIN20_006407 [Parelaphostrongylus tenuis]